MGRIEDWGLDPSAPSGHLPTLRVGRKVGEQVRKPRDANRPSGLVSAMNKDMTGLEFVQAMIDGTLPHNSMADTLGYRIVEAEKGRGGRDRVSRTTPISTRTARCMAGWPRRCSTVAWGSRS